MTRQTEFKCICGRDFDGAGGLDGHILSEAIKGNENEHGDTRFAPRTPLLSGHEDVDPEG
jgi:hypothetical protein